MWSQRKRLFSLLQRSKRAIKTVDLGKVVSLATLISAPLAFFQFRKIEPSEEVTKTEEFHFNENFRLPKTDKILSEFVIIGTGASAYSAMLAIKDVEPEANILLITEEPFPPYTRPPLSKELWDPKNNLKFANEIESVYYVPLSAYAVINGVEPNDAKAGKVRLLHSMKANSIDTSTKTIHFENGKEIVSFEKLIICTGATPRAAPFQSKAATTFRDIKDYQALSSKLPKKVVIVGGGLLGTELLYAIRNKHKECEITQIISGNGNLSKILPQYLSQWLTSMIQIDTNVQILSNAQIKSIDDNLKRITLGNGKVIEAEQIIYTIGVTPNDSLAKVSGIKIDSDYGGILVDNHMKVAQDIFAAGDVVTYDKSIKGMLCSQKRFGHYNHAIETGRIAGHNAVCKNSNEYKSIVDSSKAFSFRTILGENINFKGIGVVDSKFSTYGVWKNYNEGNTGGNSNKKCGIVFYADNEIIVGVLGLNIESDKTNILSNFLNKKIEFLSTSSHNLAKILNS